MAKSMKAEIKPDTTETDTKIKKKKKRKNVFKEKWKPPYASPVSR